MQVTSVSNTKTYFGAKNLHPIDIEYKKSLQKGLKDTYGISCNIEDLKSVAGPIELKGIISKLKGVQYEIGENFRANFHIHTRASDGYLSPAEFLAQSLEWANYIFKWNRQDDDLPPFSASITDHNRISSVKEVIANIAQNPDKYKNFKFVSGCEFLFDGYKKPYSMFEAVGLGFNPFDKALESMFRGFDSKNTVDDIPKVKSSGGIFSWAHPFVTPDKLTTEFFKFLKDKGVEAVEGFYQYKHWNKEYLDSLKPKLDELIREFGMLSTGGTDSHRKTIF